MPLRRKRYELASALLRKCQDVPRHLPRLPAPLFRDIRLKEISQVQQNPDIFGRTVQLLFAESAGGCQVRNHEVVDIYVLD